MRKWISYGFIWLAAILLIGHSLVPHVHEHSTVLAIDAKNCHPDSSYGFLGKLFSVDIGGEGHLENFLQIKSSSISFSSSDYEFECSSFFYYCSFEITQQFESNFLNERVLGSTTKDLSHYLLSHSLRAPPFG